MDGPTPATAVLSEGDVARLVEVLAEGHDRVLGPVVRDGAVTYDDLAGAEDLPRGRGADQAPGRYRLTDDPDGRWFAWAAPTQGLKRVVHPPRARIAGARRDPVAGGWVLVPPPGAAPPATAVVGVRACDLAGLAVLERVFATGVEDPTVAARHPVTTVAVACTAVAPTCFCASVGSGPAPAPGAGADVVLTELGAVPEGDHRFVAEATTAAGADLLARVGAPAASAADRQAADAAVATAADAQRRHLRTEDLPGALRTAPHSPAWTAVAARCLDCGACTSVCPTCTCTTVEDATDPAGDVAERHQVWDSCFTLGFSELHGGAVRTSGAARYRQWLTHKLDTWFDQFGELGCVGCGRCIVWCPVGIDLVAEADAVRADPGPSSYAEVPVALADDPGRGAVR